MLSKKSLNISKNLIANASSSHQCIAFQSTTASTAESTTNLKSYYDIPGPKRAPFFGSMLNLDAFGGEYNILKFRDFQHQLQAKYGDMVRWEIFSKKNVTTS
jgi:hypothetical protein